LDHWDGVACLALPLLTESDQCLNLYFAAINLQRYKTLVINVHKAPGSSRVGIGASPSSYVAQGHASGLVPRFEINVTTMKSKLRCAGISARHPGPRTKYNIIAQNQIVSGGVMGVMWSEASVGEFQVIAIYHKLLSQRQCHMYRFRGIMVDSFRCVSAIPST